MRTQLLTKKHSWCSSLFQYTLAFLSTLRVFSPLELYLSKGGPCTSGVMVMGVTCSLVDTQTVRAAQTSRLRTCSHCWVMCVHTGT